jgi:hypothetical protein
VARAIRIDGWRGFSWFGVYSRVRPAGRLQDVPPETLRRYLVAMLQHRLYADFYQPGTPRAANSVQGSGQHASGGGFVQELSHANTGTGYWEPGWRVQGVEAEHLLVQKEGLVLSVPREACSADVAGAAATVRMPKELLKASPGYYLAFGNLPLDADRQGDPILRVYFNVAPEKAGPAMRELTQRLNARQLPFRLKAVNDPSRYDRCDSLVLYLHRGDYGAGAGELQALVDDLALGSGVPAFTKPIARGVAIAEDPPDGSSFGLHRCGLLAESLVRASEAGASSEASLLHLVEEHFASHGISLSSPYLNPSSTDVYEPLSHSKARSVPRRDKPRVELPGYLESAQSIAEALCSAAIVSNGRATWLGPSPRVPHERRIASLGPDLYAGTSGVALFLAELGHATSDRRVKQTARQALEHALSHLNEVEPQARPAFYTGWLGIAYACARAGAVLAEPGLVEKAIRLADQAADAGLETSWENDLLSGKAGAICALLTLCRLLNDRGLEARAQDYGEQLIEDAVRSSEGWSWGSPHSPGAVNLTGLSHGTAGIALGLLELYRCGHGSEYKEAALSAFEYERHWFDQESQNWPDFREVNRRPVRVQKLPYFTAWCHGAPGIALSRRRAIEILGVGSVETPGLLAEANAGFEATRRAVEANLTLAEPELCLCHGLTGNLEILLDGSPGLAERTALATRVASVALPGRHQEGAPITAGQRVDLMTGLAGVGLFYLRLADPSVPSVLLLRPETLAIDNHRSSV